MKVATILGTRPEIIRLAAVLQELDRSCEHVLIHTGQNYDRELNEIFFTELGLRKPDYVLDAVGDTVVQTIANIISKVEPVLLEVRPDAVLVLGDTNSALSVLAAKRHKIPVFHMEAGNRCFDERVPEEINRRTVDHLSDINLVYSDHARRMLLREGFPPDRIIKTGSPIFEVLQMYMPKIDASKILADMNLVPQGYFLASFHREENVTIENNLRGVVEGLRTLAEKHGKPVVVSTHPRTRAALEALGILSDDHMHFLKPLGLFDYVHLQKHAACVLSDSGTVSEESSVLQIPSVMIREAHERAEGMDEAVTVMAGPSANEIVDAAELAMKGSYGPSGFRMVPDYSVPNVSKKIPRLIMSHIGYVHRKVWSRYK